MLEIIEIDKIFKDITLKIVVEIQDELVKQSRGVKGKSALIDSIYSVVLEKNGNLIGEFYMQDYWPYIEYGVNSSRIPYNPGSGRDFSKYIENLIKWINVTLNKYGSEAKSTAFKIANVHIVEGMPTIKSHNLSNTNSKIGALDKVFLRSENWIINYMSNELLPTIELKILNVLNSENKVIKI